MMSRPLVLFSAAVFSLVGLAYLFLPAAALSIVGLESDPVRDFLMRTEGVALLFGAAMLWPLRHGAWIGPARRHAAIVQGEGCGFYSADWAMRSRHGPLSGPWRP